MSPWPFVSRAKALPAKGSEKGMGTRMPTILINLNPIIVNVLKKKSMRLNVLSPLPIIIELIGLKLGQIIVQ